MNRDNTDNPYAINERRSYPSQAVDYFSLSAGGAYTDAERHSQQRQGHSQQQKNQGNIPYFYQDTRGSFRGAGRGGFAGRGRDFHRRPYKPNNRNNYGSGGGASNRMSNDHFRPRTNAPSSKEETYATYFHPSMLEDPWKELMNRLQAIRKSAINMEKSDASSTGSDVDKDGDNKN